MGGMRLFLVSAAFVAAALASTAHAQLLGEHVEGMKRLCFYRIPGGLNNQSDRRVLQVGIGQACPPQYREPEPERQPRVIIPGTAVLRESRRVSGQMVCTYRSGSRDYLRRLPPGQSCPITPY
jgi:hypothetical protein